VNYHHCNLKLTDDGKLLKSESIIKVIILEICNTCTNNIPMSNIEWVKEEEQTTILNFGCKLIDEGTLLKSESIINTHIIRLKRTFTCTQVLFIAIQVQCCPVLWATSSGSQG